MVDIGGIKTHLRENKKVYIVGGSALLIGFTGGALYAAGGIQIIDSFNFLKWASPHTSFTVLIRRGHPGNIVKCIETGELFGSQNHAAAANGMSRSMLSQHLNGKTEAAKGLHFEKLGEAAATIAK